MVAIKWNVILIENLLQIRYSSFQNSDLHMSIITNKLQVLKSIIIFNAILMVYDLPSMKATTKMFRHYKAVFTNIIAMFLNHRVKEIIWKQSDKHVSMSIHSSATPPCRSFPPNASFSRAGTTKFITQSPLYHTEPSFPPAVNACTVLVNMANAFMAYKPTFPCLSQNWHTYIITGLRGTVKRLA